MDEVTKVFTREDVMGLLLGLFAPVIISALKNKGWVMWKKMATVGVVSVALAAIAVFLTSNGLNAIDIKQVSIWTLGTAIPAYKLIWEGTAVDQRATELNLVMNTKENIKEAVESVTEDKKE